MHAKAHDKLPFGATLHVVSWFGPGLFLAPILFDPQAAGIRVGFGIGAAGIGVLIGSLL